MVDSRIVLLVLILVNDEIQINAEMNNNLLMRILNNLGKENFSEDEFLLSDYNKSCPIDKNKKLSGHMLDDDDGRELSAIELQRFGKMLKNEAPRDYFDIDDESDSDCNISALWDTSLKDIGCDKNITLLTMLRDMLNNVVLLGASKLRKNALNSANTGSNRIYFLASDANDKWDKPLMRRDHELTNYRDAFLKLNSGGKSDVVQLNPRMFDGSFKNRHFRDCSSHRNVSMAESNINYDNFVSKILEPYLSLSHFLNILNNTKYPAISSRGILSAGKKFPRHQTNDSVIRNSSYLKDLLAVMPHSAVGLSELSNSTSNGTISLSSIMSNLSDYRFKSLPEHGLKKLYSLYRDINLKDLIEECIRLHMELDKVNPNNDTLQAYFKKLFTENRNLPLKNSTGFTSSPVKMKYSTSNIKSYIRSNIKNSTVNNSTSLTQQALVNNTSGLQMDFHIVKTFNELINRNKTLTTDAIDFYKNNNSLNDCIYMIKDRNVVNLLRKIDKSLLTFPSVFEYFEIHKDKKMQKIGSNQTESKFKNLNVPTVKLLLNDDGKLVRNKIAKRFIHGYQTSLDYDCDNSSININKPGVLNSSSNGYGSQNGNESFMKESIMNSVHPLITTLGNGKSLMIDKLMKLTELKKGIENGKNSSAHIRDLNCNFIDSKDIVDGDCTSLNSRPIVNVSEFNFRPNSSAYDESKPLKFINETAEPYSNPHYVGILNNSPDNYQPLLYFNPNLESTSPLYKTFSSHTNDLNYNNAKQSFSDSLNTFSDSKIKDSLYKISPPKNDRAMWLYNSDNTISPSEIDHSVFSSFNISKVSGENFQCSITSRSTMKCNSNNACVKCSKKGSSKDTYIVEKIYKCGKTTKKCSMPCLKNLLNRNSNSNITDLKRCLFVLNKLIDHLGCV